MDLRQLTDVELYKLCREYGHNAVQWRRKFAGLLPEVQRRTLYYRRGFGSIYEFSFKLCGLSRETVDRILMLSRRLKDMPCLLALLESGQGSWTKIERVAWVATSKTDSFWAEKVQTMTARALTEFVKGQKNTAGGIPDDKPELRKMSFKMTSQVEQKLRLVKQSLEKDKKRLLSFNEVIDTLVEKAPQPQTEIKICPECARRKALEAKGRHIPAETKRYVYAKYNGLCGFQNCRRPATSLHHTRRYALNPSHDPDFLVPLCHNHERLAHSGHIENELEDPRNWKLLEQPDKLHPKYQVDQIVAEKRRF